MENFLRQGRSFVLMAFFLFQPVFSKPGGKEKVVWPLTIEKQLTSSFAEYRSGHFHAALDLRTRGREGFPVSAVSDGSIFKLRTSPFGYGKVVYLRHTNGHFSIYAHLSKFAGGLSKRVRAIQEKTGRYSITQIYLVPIDGVTQSLASRLAQALRC